MRFLLLAFILIFQPAAEAHSLCGSDSRVSSAEPQVGMPYENFGCTITLIGKSCALTAGHCTPRLKSVAFNVKFRADGGRVFQAQDIYQVEQNLLVADAGSGQDYAVIKLRPNNQSHLLPGEVQGFLPVAINYRPRSQESVTITGHGNQSTISGVKYHQKWAQGPVVWTTSREILHQVDTTTGDSGAAIRNSNGEIVGIHTHEGCNQNGGSNRGILIAGNPELKAAILSCLE